MSSNYPRNEILLVDVAGKKLNFASDDSVTSILWSSDESRQRINGAADIDYVINSADNSTVNAGGSTVFNHGSNTRINGTFDADSIETHGESVTLNGAGGNDTIMFGGGSLKNIGNSAQITLQNSALLNNTGSNVKIYGSWTHNKDLHDTITNSGNYAWIYLNQNASSVDNTGEYVTIAGTGNNPYNPDEISTITNRGDHASIFSYHCTINNAGAYVTIQGNNKVLNSGEYNSIEACDSVDNFGAHSTIIGHYSGSGTITNYASDIKIIVSNRNGFISLKGTNQFISYNNIRGDNSYGSFSDTIWGLAGTDTLSFSPDDSVSVTADHIVVPIYISGNRSNYTKTLYLEDAFNKKLNFLNYGQLSSRLYTGTSAGQNVYGAADIDSVISAAVDSTINANGSRVYNMGANTRINGTSGADWLETHSDNATINGAGGNDIIIGTGVFKNIGNSTRIILDNSSSLDNTGENVTIDGREGNDSITNSGARVRIHSSYCDDSIRNDGSNVSLNAGDGNDTILNSSENVTINAGAGDNVISLGGSKQLVEYGGGNDTIFGLSGTDTLYVGSRAWLYDLKWHEYLSGNNLIISSQTYTYGSGYTTKTLTVADVINKKINLASAYDRFSVLLANDNSNQTINGAADIDYVISSANNSTLNSNGSTVYSKGSNMLINGSNADELIEILQDTSTVRAGAGNDTIKGNGSIDGGDGHDFIEGHGSIDGGLGNDRINLLSGENVIEYAAGEGFDTVYGFDENDTLKITGGAISSASVDGIAVVVNVGTSSVRLNNMLGRQLNLIDANGSATQTVVGSAIDGTEGNDSITLTGSKNVVNGSNGNDTIYGLDEDDTIRYHSEYWQKPSIDGSDLIFYDDYWTEENEDGRNEYIFENSLRLVNAVDKKFNVISNDGRMMYSPLVGLTLTGSSDIGSVNNRFDNVFIDVSARNDGVNIYSAGEDYDGVADAVKNVTVKGGVGNDTITFSRAISAFVDAGNGNNIIGDNGDLNDFLASTIKSGAGNDSVYVYSTKTLIDVGAGNDSIIISDSDLVYNRDMTIYGGDGNDTMNIIALDSSIDGGTGDDMISVKGLNDYLFNTIVGGLGNDTVDIDGDGAAYHWIYRYDGGNDIIDAGNAFADLIQLNGGAIGSASIDGEDAVFKIGSGSLTLKNRAANNYYEFSPIVFKDKNGNFSTWYVGSDQNYEMTINSLGASSTLENNGFFNSKSNVKLISENFGTEDEEFYPYSIVNTGRNVSINGSTDENGNYFGSITNYGDNATLTAAQDSSYETQIQNLFANNVLINSPFSVYNSGNRVTINGGDYTDYTKNLRNSGSDVLINGIYRDQRAINTGSNVTINGSGDFENSGDGFLINFRAYESNSIYNIGLNSTIKGSTSADTIKNGMTEYCYYDLFEGSRTLIQSGAGNDHIENHADDVTIEGGAGDDVIDLNGAREVLRYAANAGNDTIYNLGNDDTLEIAGEYSTMKSDYDMIISLDGGSISINGAFNDSEGERKINIVDASPEEATSLSSGIEYDSKKPSKLVVKDPFSGVVDASAFSDRITLIDANDSSKEVILKAGAKATVIEAGTGVSTLIGGAKDDKLYGGSGVNTFVYNAGAGKDAVFDYEAQDIISIVGATRDKLIFTDKKDAVIITFDGDKKSQLTINKVNTTEALNIDTDGETFKYGELPSGVTFDDNSKKTGLNVGATAADGVTVNAIDIVSTAKTLNGADAGGTVHLIGNGNKNVIQAGKNGSTLYGGKFNVADKLIGGDGADVFIYSEGDGADVISNFDGSKGDYVLLDGVTDLKADAVKWSGNKLFATVGNQKLTLEDPQGAVKFGNDSGVTLQIVGINFPVGVGYNKNKTAVTVGAEASDLLTSWTIDLSDSLAYVSTVKDVNATAYGGALGIIGNANANVFYAGKGGSTLDGGESDDKLHGGAGADVFVYDGQGADVIYGFDGTKDKVILNGVTKLDAKDVSVSVNKVVVTVGNQKLTLNDPQGKVQFVDSDGNELYSVGTNFSTGVGYNKNKTAITVDGTASDVEMIDLSGAAYVSTVKEVNATAYGGALEIIGNGNANVLRAGAGNATLNGGYDANKNKVTADKLYGSTVEGSSDVFVWDAFLGGGDQIFNYSAAAGDIISVTADKALTIDKTDFKESGNKIVLSAGGGKLTINDVKDQPVVVVNGDDTITFGSLPGGITYADNKKSLKIADPFVGTIQADDYASSVVTLDGSTATGEITLVGNKKAKVFKGGAGQTTMIGSAAADIFHAGTGADVIYYSDGKDIVYDFDATKDIIKLSGATVSATDFVEKGNNIVINVGKGSITLKDAPRGTITVEQSGGKLTYKTLPSNVTYKAAKEVVTLAKDFSGTLNAVDLQLPVKEINGSASKNEAYLKGMSTATKLTASKGGSTLVGGAGNDTMIGGNGNDLFITSGGSDFIDKYTSGKDKIRIEGTLNAGKVSGSNVEITTSNGTVTVKDVLNKELTLTVDGADQKYKFTKTNNTLDKALVTGNAQQPADDYWFLPSDDANDEIRSLLNEITTADDAALGSLDISFEQSAMLELTSNVKIKSVRHHKK